LHQLHPVLLATLIVDALEAGEHVSPLAGMDLFGDGVTGLDPVTLSQWRS